jgi:hypothetical protein
MPASKRPLAAVPAAKPAKPPSRLACRILFGFVPSMPNSLVDFSNTSELEHF